jgi:hypothetical protein
MIYREILRKIPFWGKPQWGWMTFKFNNLYTVKKVGDMRLIYIMTTFTLLQGPEVDYNVVWLDEETAIE